jgi:hypothetical protein
MSDETNQIVSYTANLSPEQIKAKYIDLKMKLQNHFADIRSWKNELKDIEPQFINLITSEPGHLLPINENQALCYRITRRTKQISLPYLRELLFKYWRDFDTTISDAEVQQMVENQYSRLLEYREVFLIHETYIQQVDDIYKYTSSRIRQQQKRTDKDFGVLTLYDNRRKRRKQNTVEHIQNQHLAIEHSNNYLHNNNN